MKRYVINSRTRGVYENNIVGYSENAVSVNTSLEEYEKKEHGKDGILYLKKQSNSSFNRLGKFDAKVRYLVEKRDLSNAFEHYTN